MGIDEDLRNALKKLAMGHTYEEREVIALRDGSPERVKVTQKQVSPDLKAITRIQALRDMGQWEE